MDTQRQVEEELQTNGLTEKGVQIKMKGGRFSAKQQSAVVHSEFAALISEKWKIVVAKIEQSIGKKPKRNVNSLLFQTRDKNTTVPARPTNTE